VNLSIQFSLFFFFTRPWQAIQMLWSTSLPLLGSSLLAFVTSGLAVPHARAGKHYAIMDNDWYTAGFVPYLVALDGDVEILGLAAGECLHSAYIQHRDDYCNDETLT
jgi:hypothetical protein